MTSTISSPLSKSIKALNLGLDRSFSPSKGFKLFLWIWNTWTLLRKLYNYLFAWFTICLVDSCCLTSMYPAWVKPWVLLYLLHSYSKVNFRTKASLLGGRFSSVIFLFSSVSTILLACSDWVTLASSELLILKSMAALCFFSSMFCSPIGSGC